MRRGAAWVLALLLAISLVGCGQKAPTRLEAAATADADQGDAQAQTQPDEWSREVIAQGKTWRFNSHLRTILFMGVDTRTTEQEARYGLGNGGRSDTIILLVIDPDNQIIQPVTLSRDTMTQVDVYDRDRNYLFSGTMQLTMQYSFGDNPKRSCLLMKRKVSDLLYGLPIHAYCSMTLDGITVASELVGGVSLRLEEDWTDIDPSYVAGSTITLDADALESFLRYRDTGVSGSNDVRMRRQGWFIRQLFDQLSSLSGSNIEVLLKQLDPYIETDMDGDMLRHLTEFHVSSTILNVPGQTIPGRAHDEYYIDEDGLKQLLLELYYAPDDA